MSEFLGDALLELRANIAPLRRGMMEGEAIVRGSMSRMDSTVGRRMASLSGTMSRVGSGLTRTVTLPILGVAGAAAKFAADFDRAMEMIHTQAGAPQREVDKLRSSVLALAKTLPQSPTTLAAGLFHLESIGLRGAKAMDTLKIAAQGAAVGHADLESTATALGSAWLVNIKGAGNLRDVMAILNATVGAGNMRMQDLVEALGTGVLPASKLAGIGIRDVMAALAVLTDEGYKASSAGAQFATALHFLYNPTAKAEKALSSIGLSGAKLAGDMHKPEGLLKTFQDLSVHLDKLPGGRHGVAAEQLLGDIFPAGRGRVMLTLLNQMDRYSMKLKQISRGQSQFADDIHKTMEQPAVRIQKAWAGLQSELISFGDKALPPLLAAGGQIVHWMTQALHGFSALSPGAQKAIITGGLIMAGIGPAMRVLGMFTGGIARAWDLAAKFSRMAFGPSRFGPSSAAATAAAASRMVANMEVADMGVGTMVVRSMVSGGRGAPGSPVGRSGSSTSRYSTAPPTSGGRTPPPATPTSTQRLGNAFMRGIGALGVAAFAVPLGIAAKDAIQHWIQKSADDQGRQWADKFTGALPGRVSTKTREGLRKSFQDAHFLKNMGDMQKQYLDALTPGQRRRVGTAATGGYFNEGYRAGQAFIEGYKHVKFPGTPSFERQMMARLRSLDPQAREQAARMMLGMAKSLEDHGKLPRGALNRMILSLHRQFPELLTFVGKMGKDADRIFADYLKFHQSTHTLANTLYDFRNKFGGFGTDVQITWKNVDKYTQIAMKDLKWQMQHGSAEARKAATAEWKKLQQETTNRLKVMQDDVATRTNQMKNSIRDNTGNAANIAGANLWALVKHIQDAMAAGVIKSSDGGRLIATALNNALQSFGAKKIPMPQAVVMQNLAARSAGSFGMAGVSGPHGHMKAHERGGLVQVGRPGARGPDRIPFSVGGTDIVVGEGEKVAVFNADQQREADRRFRDVGGLRGFFSGRRWRPHHMATGGIVTASTFGGPGDPGTGSTGYRGDDLYAKPDSYAELNMGTALGSLPYMAPLDVSYRGKTEHLFKRDIGAGGAGIGGRTRAIDLWFQAAQALGMTGLANVLVGGASGLKVSPGGALTDIPVPKVKGDGTVSDETRAILKKMAAAANTYLQAHMPAVNTSVLGGPPARHGKYFFPLPPGTWTAGAVDQGWDLAAPGHTPLFAIESGTIIGHGASGFGPWAPMLSLDGGGSLYYGHAGPGGGLPVGTHVKAGQVLGEVGAGIVGMSTGPHLEIGWLPFGGMGAGIAMKRALGYRKGGYVGAKATRKTKTSSLPTKARKFPHARRKNLPNIPGFGGSVAINAPSKATTIDKLNRIIAKINHVTGKEIPTLQDRYQYKSQDYDLKDFVFVVTPPNGGPPHIDQAAVSERTAELMQLIGWQNTILKDAEGADKLTGPLPKLLRRAIGARLGGVGAREKRIRGNLRNIKYLNDHMPKDSKAKAAVNRQIRALKDENSTLGGDQTKVGKSGEIGDLTKEITRLRSIGTTVDQDRMDLEGASGIGGLVGDTKYTLTQLGKQLNELSPGSLAKALADAGGGTGVSSDNSSLIAALQQLVLQQGQEIAVMRAQAPVLGSLPPYGGSFATGGIVPGPSGAARTIIAHGGEEVGGRSQSNIRVVVEDQRVRVFHDDVEQIVQQVTRRMVGNRGPLPGNGGGRFRR